MGAAEAERAAPILASECRPLRVCAKHSSFQRRQIVGHRSPNRVQINPFIRMTKLVSDAPNVAPDPGATVGHVARSARYQLNPVESRQDPLNVEPARAVAQRFRSDTGLIEHAQQQIRHGRVVGVFEVPSALELPRPAARNNGWERRMVVKISVADATPVKNHGVVEQRAITVRGLP